MKKSNTSTTVLWPKRMYRRRFSLMSDIFLVAFLALALPVVGHAQKFGGPITVPRNFNKGTVVAPEDYFLKDVDPYIKNDVFQRERYHMGKEFWEAVRGGKFQRALDDL